jgi:hypothetical protein
LIIQHKSLDSCLNGFSSAFGDLLDLGIIKSIDINDIQVGRNIDELLEKVKVLIKQHESSLK